MAYKTKSRGCIPKSKFPRVLKNTLDRLNNNNCASRNLISELKATKIFPLDENKVFCIISTCSTDLNESVNTKTAGSSWCEIFEQFLADTRVKKTSNFRKKKQRKKVSVQPGKSITSKAALSEEEYFNINQPSTSNYKYVSNTPSVLASHNKNIKLPSIQENVISGFSKDDFVFASLLYNTSNNFQIIY